MGGWCAFLVDGVYSDRELKGVGSDKGPWAWLRKPAGAQVMALFARIWDTRLQNFVFGQLGFGLAFLSSSAIAMFNPLHFTSKGCNLLFGSSGVCFRGSACISEDTLNFCINVSLFVSLWR